MSMRTGVCLVLCQWLLAAASLAADFDGDGKPDEFKTTRSSSALAGGKGVRVVNPWSYLPAPRKNADLLCLFVQLSGASQSYLIRSSFFDTPMWSEKTLPLKVIATKVATIVAATNGIAIIR